LIISTGAGFFIYDVVRSSGRILPSLPDPLTFARSIDCSLAIRRTEGDANMYGLACKSGVA